MLLKSKRWLRQEERVRARFLAAVGMPPELLLDSGSRGNDRDLVGPPLQTALTARFGFPKLAYRVKISSFGETFGGKIP